MSSEKEIDNNQQAPEAQDTAAETPSVEEEKAVKAKAPKKPAEKKAAPKKAAAKEKAPEVAKRQEPAAEAKEEAVEAEKKPAVVEKAVAAEKTETAVAVPKAEVPKKEAAPPPPPEQGRYGQLLQANGFNPVALGKDSTGGEMVELKANELKEACQLLRDSSASEFDLLVSIAGVDWQDRLEGVYHLYSTKSFDKMVVKATAVDEKLPSVVSVWQTADWHEREAFDLFGIVFEGHPNLQRILMPSDWIGYPMRKNYKVEDPRLVWNER